MPRRIERYSVLLTIHGEMELDTRVAVAIISCYEQKNKLVKKNEYNKMMMCISVPGAIVEQKIDPDEIKYLIISPRAPPEVLVETMIYVREKWNFEIDLVTALDNYMHLDIKNKKMYAFDAEFISEVSPHTTE